MLDQTMWKNVDVWRYMFAAPDSISSVISGSSVHNKCVERLWCDDNRCVASPFAEKFRKRSTI